MGEQIHTVTFRPKDEPDRRIERVFTSRRAAETFVKTLPAWMEVITASGHQPRQPYPRGRSRIG